MARAPHPLVVIGLDGATFDVLDPLIERGELPVLGRLANSGLRTELRSTMPPVTLPAWTSFLTAASPGQHGVTDIFVHPPGSYDLRPANATLRRVPTFLARLASAGYRVASLGVPGTYPPEPLPGGLCVAGFDAPGASAAGPDAVWPASLYAELRRLGGWRYATFNELAAGDDPGRRVRTAVAGLLADIERKERLILALHRREPWDLFFVHLQASDTAGHHLWHTYDPRSPRFIDLGPSVRDALPSVYRRLDRLIGRVLEGAPAGARVLVVSDHGMGGAADLAVHLNRWLHERGLLHFRSAGELRAAGVIRRALRAALGRLPPSALGAMLRAAPPALASLSLRLARGGAADLLASAAFSDELDYAPSIWLNRRSRFSDGTLGEADADRVREEIAAAVKELRHPATGEPLIAAVHRREACFAGPARELGADLVLEPAWPGGYRPSFLPSDGPGPVVRTLSGSELFAPKGSGMPGVHRRDGVFIAAGAGLRATEIPLLHLAQAGALVYALLGLPIPEDLEAQPPAHLLSWLPPPSGDHAPTPAIAVAAASSVRSAAGDLLVSERLRKLGYID